MRRGLTVTPRALARYCVTFSDTTELHVSQSVKDSNTTRYQKVPGEYGHHHVWVVYDKLDVGGCEFTEWPAKACIWKARNG